MSDTDAKQGSAGRKPDAVDAIIAAIQRGVDAVARSRLASCVAILLVALICMLPGFVALQPIDRDEARFAQATRHMLESGNVISVQLQDDERDRKPAGIHWLQAIAASVSGQGTAAPIHVFRLPSLLGAIAATLLTWWTAMAFGNRRVALLAGVMMAASVLLGAEARLATAEAVLLAGILASCGALARVWLRPDSNAGATVAAIFWAGLALAILVKGAVGPFFVILLVAWLVIERASVRWLGGLRPKAGLIGLAVAVVPWYLAISFATGGEYWSGSSEKDFWPEFASLDEGYEAPPGTLFLLIGFTFWPAAAYFTLALPQIVDRLRQPALMFAAAAAIPFWLALEAFGPKLPHYVLPAYPMLAIATAVALDAGAVRVRGWLGWLLSLGPVAVPTFFAIAVPTAFFVLEGRVPVAGTVVLWAGAAVGAGGWYLLAYRHAAIASLAVTLASAALLYLGVYQMLLPQMEQLRISGRLAELARQSASCSNPQLASAGYGEPSLVFLAGPSIRLTDSASAADFLAGGDCRLAIVEHRSLPQFLERAEDLGFDTIQRGQTTGVNISNGRRLSFGLYERQPGQAGTGP